MRKIYVFKLVVLLVWFSFLGAGCASERVGGNDVEAEKKSEIPLDQFIYKALYNPKKGYYMKNIPFGKDGDFITAPNISKI